MSSAFLSRGAKSGRGQDQLGFSDSPLVLSSFWAQTPNGGDPAANLWHVVTGSGSYLHSYEPGVAGRVPFPALAAARAYYPSVAVIFQLGAMASGGALTDTPEDTPRPPVCFRLSSF